MATPSNATSADAAATRALDPARVDLTLTGAPDLRRKHGGDTGGRAPPFPSVSLGSIVEELNANLGRMNAAAEAARRQGRVDEAARIDAEASSMDRDIARLSRR